MASGTLQLGIHLASARTHLAEAKADRQKAYSVRLLADAQSAVKSNAFVIFLCNLPLREFVNLRQLLANECDIAEFDKQIWRNLEFREEILAKLEKSVNSNSDTQYSLVSLWRSFNHAQLDDETKTQVKKQLSTFTSLDYLYHYICKPAAEGAYHNFDQFLQIVEEVPLGVQHEFFRRYSIDPKSKFATDLKRPDCEPDRLIREYVQHVSNPLLNQLMRHYHDSPALTPPIINAVVTPKLIRVANIDGIVGQIPFIGWLVRLFFGVSQPPKVTVLKQLEHFKDLVENNNAEELQKFQESLFTPELPKEPIAKLVIEELIEKLIEEPAPIPVEEPKDRPMAPAGGIPASTYRQQSEWMLAELYDELNTDEGEYSTPVPTDELSTYATLAPTLGKAPQQSSAPTFEVPIGGIELTYSPISHREAALPLSPLDDSELQSSDGQITPPTPCQQVQREVTSTHTQLWRALFANNDSIPTESGVNQQQEQTISAEININVKTDQSADDVNPAKDSAQTESNANNSFL